MSEQAIVHELSEIGQARREEPIELLVVACRTALRALGTSVLWGSIVTGGRWLFGDNMTWWSVLVTYGAIGALRFGLSIEDDLDDHQEGLRAEKSARSYAPIAPKSQPQMSNGPPVLVHPYKGDPYMLGQPEKPTLPGRQEALQITPPLVAEVLRASVEEYSGEWSRRKLMRLRIAGQKVSRGMYEELTAWLSRAGVLLQTRQGGYQLPPDVNDFEDLRQYFPNLPGLGGPGRNREGWERGGAQPTQPADGGVPLAERHRMKRFQKLDHSVKLYLRGAP